MSTQGKRKAKVYKAVSSYITENDALRAELSKNADALSALTADGPYVYNGDRDYSSCFWCGQEDTDPHGDGCAWVTARKVLGLPILTDDQIQVAWERDNPVHTCHNENEPFGRTMRWLLQSAPISAPLRNPPADRFGDPK